MSMSDQWALGFLLSVIIVAVATRNSWRHRAQAWLDKNINEPRTVPRPPIVSAHSEGRAMDFSIDELVSRYPALGERVTLSFWPGHFRILGKKPYDWEKEPPDARCYTMPDGECVASGCELHQGGER